MKHLGNSFPRLWTTGQVGYILGFAQILNTSRCICAHEHINDKRQIEKGISQEMYNLLNGGPNMHITLRLWTQQECVAWHNNLVLCRHTFTYDNIHSSHFTENTSILLLMWHFEDYTFTNNGMFLHSGVDTFTYFTLITSSSADIWCCSRGPTGIPVENFSKKEKKIFFLLIVIIKKEQEFKITNNLK